MKDKLYILLLKQGFRPGMARIIVAQSAHETAVLGVPWNSAIFLENNNPFGMKQALIRPTTNTGVSRGHAVYNSLEDAVKDYRYWFNFSGMLPEYTTPETFAQALKQKSYYTAEYSEYAAGLRYWFNKLWHE